MTQIVIGDKVRVVNPGNLYTTFNDWATRNRLNKWAERECVRTGDILTVLVLATHGRTGGEMLVGLEAADGKQFIMGLDGVSFVSRVNGITRDGNPLMMSADSLKPFQRIKTANGRTAVVTLDSDGGKSLVYPNNMYGDVRFTESTNSASGYYIVEVYEAPRAALALDINAYGKLVWKSADIEKIEAKRKAAEAVATAKATLAKAEAELSAL